MKDNGKEESNVETANWIKGVISAVFAFLSALLGDLAIPVALLIVCNIVDYCTGIIAAKHRGQKISSYVGLEGIAKKVCMWLLVVVGAVADKMLLYTADAFGIEMRLKYFIAAIVAIWLVCNELISILENIADTGVAIPGFLMPLIKNIKSKVEEKAELPDQTKDEKESAVKKDEDG